MAATIFKNEISLVILSTCCLFVSSLEFTASPSYVTIGQTKNVTLTCDARSQSASFSAVTFMQMSKVNANGSPDTLVELIAGTQAPTVLDSGLLKRAQASGSLDRAAGVYLSLSLPTPILSDSGNYSCTISYLDTNHRLTTDVADGLLNVVDLPTLQAELNQLKSDFKNLTSQCACGTKDDAVAFSIRIFSTLSSVEATGDVIGFNMADLDSHKGFNPSDHSYVVPASGTYSITLTLTGDASGDDFQASVTVNHVIKAAMLVKKDQTSSLSTTLKLVKGQEVRVETEGKAIVRSQRFSSLSGVMMAS